MRKKNNDNNTPWMMTKEINGALMDTLNDIRKATVADISNMMLFSKDLMNNISGAAVANYNKEQKRNNNHHDVVVTTALPIVTGLTVYGSTLAMSTWAQLKVLGVSTGTQAPIPTLLGIASVCLASLASHRAATTIQNYNHVAQHLLELKPQEFINSLSWESLSSNYNNNRSRSKNKKFRENPTEYLDLANGNVKIPLLPIRICLIGLLSFKLLGGRFWAISPSSYTNVGSFARVSLPCTERYATATQRAKLQQIGKRWGCHTCGSRMITAGARNAARASRGGSTSSLFVGDHMPPKSVAQQMNSRWYRRLLGLKVKFRFYPQCIHCSNKQGSILSAATSSQGFKNLAQSGGGKYAHNHALRLRLFHISGAIIGTSAAANNNNNGNNSNSSTR